MPITTTKLSKNKTSRQCRKHRRLATLSYQEDIHCWIPTLGIAVDRGSFRKTGAGLNPRQLITSRPEEPEKLISGPAVTKFLKRSADGQTQGIGWRTSEN